MTSKFSPAPSNHQDALNPKGPNPRESRRQLWLAAIKPPMYSVAVIPIWVGSAVAWAEQSRLNWQVLGTFLVSAILIIAWLNTSNDVFDAETGIDRNKHHSLVNLTQNKSIVFGLANLFLMLGLAGVLAIAGQQQDLTVMGIILLCCALGYSYQGPPFRLGYLGLGEPICFVTFGPLAIAAAYYSQTQTWSGTNWLVLGASGAIVGTTTSLILFCSHFHQIADDTAAGKKSPVVRLGTEKAARLLPWICGSVFIVIAILAGLNIFPLTTALVLASAPIAIHLCRYVWTHHNQPNLVKNCKFIAVSFHFWSGLLLGLAFPVGDWLS